MRDGLRARLDRPDLASWLADWLSGLSGERALVSGARIEVLGVDGAVPVQGDAAAVRSEWLAS